MKDCRLLLSDRSATGQELERAAITIGLATIKILAKLQRTLRKFSKQFAKPTIFQHFSKQCANLDDSC